jgi:hypothetical protein
MHRLHPFSEDIYGWLQLADGYRLPELRTKRDLTLKTFDNLLERFDTEFTYVLQYMDQQKFQSEAAKDACLHGMKQYLRIFRNYIAEEMAYLDGFPYVFAEFWHPTVGLQLLKRMLHDTGMYVLDLDVTVVRYLL